MSVGARLFMMIVGGLMLVWVCVWVLRNGR